MKDVNSNNFGLVIAYLVPGYVVLIGLGRVSAVIGHWLATSPDASTTISGFMFGTLAAVGAGLIVNAIRWHVVDPLHYASGVPRKIWDYPTLPHQVSTFQYLVDKQFRYYECYANMMVAISLSSAIWFATSASVDLVLVALFIAIQLVLWSASRRTLLNYHSRVAVFLRHHTGRSDGSIETIDPPTRNCYTSTSMVRRRRGIFAFILRRKKRPLWASIDTIHRRASVK